eukprot:m.73874 g.73874  ORF g.73874 m.73874 type:complete len:108 (+) comp12436_c0_seq7:2653-2976(+)
MTRSLLGTFEKYAPTPPAPTQPPINIARICVVLSPRPCAYALLFAQNSSRLLISSLVGGSRMIGILDVGVPFSSYLAEFGIMHDHSMKNDFSTLGNTIVLENGFNIS